MIIRDRCAGSPVGLLSAVLALGVLFAAFPARAEDAAPVAGANDSSVAPEGAQREVPPPPPPSAEPPATTGTMSVETPPPPPVRGRTYHMHDGFYLRMNLGGGYIGSSIGQSGSPDITLSGGGGAFDLMIGGTLGRGVVIGGALLGNTAPNPSYEVDGKQQDVAAQVSFLTLGPFIDGFPDPKGGFHVGGMFGAAGLSLEDTVGGSSSTTTFGGYGAGVWVGYAAWIAPEWSMGGMLRLTGARTVHAATDTTPKRTASAQAITILFTALYH